MKESQVKPTAHTQQTVLNEQCNASPAHLLFQSAEMRRVFLLNMPQFKTIFSDIEYKT